MLADLTAFVQPFCPHTASPTASIEDVREIPTETDIAPTHEPIPALNITPTENTPDLLSHRIAHTAEEQRVLSAEPTSVPPLPLPVSDSTDSQVIEAALQPSPISTHAPCVATVTEVIAPNIPVSQAVE